jgi:hypothetical protein
VGALFWGESYLEVRPIPSSWVSLSSTRWQLMRELAFLFLTYRAFLPLIFVPLVVPLSPYWSSIGTDIRPSTMEGVTPSTTQSVLMTLSHLHALNAMLPPTTVDPVHISWLKSWKDMERHRLIRGGISIWVMWIGLNLALGGRAVSQRVRFLGWFILLIAARCHKR